MGFLSLFTAGQTRAERVVVLHRAPAWSSSPASDSSNVECRIGSMLVHLMAPKRPLRQKPLLVFPALNV